jgi:hypothetical protein
VRRLFGSGERPSSLESLSCFFVVVCSSSVSSPSEELLLGEALTLEWGCTDVPGVALVETGLDFVPSF